MASVTIRVTSLLIGLVAAFSVTSNTLAFVPVFGGPTYNSSARTGYQFNSQSIQVNNIGMAIATFNKFAGSTSVVAGLPLTWSTDGSAPIELTGPPGYSTSPITKWAYAINDSNTVVGAAYNDTLGERPIRWDAAGVGVELANLGTRLGGTFTWGQAYAISNSGTVVGYSERWVGSSYFDRAARWNAGGIAITELGDVPQDPVPSRYPLSRALAVNESNTAVGYAQKLSPGGVNLGFRPVRWDGSGTAATELGNLGTSSGGVASGQAVDVNESGVAVGYVLVGGAGPRKAVRWNADTTSATELDDLGGLVSEARAINDASAAVGYSGSSAAKRALRWDANSSAAILLGYLVEPAASEAFDINNQFIAVGTAVQISGGGSQGSRAVAWQPSGLAVDLNRLIDPTSGWTLTMARSISETNLISGVGQYDPDGTGGVAAYTRTFTLQLPDALPGDYNADYMVDAADYVVWRKSDGSAAGYDDWRSNFGNMVSSNAAVAITTAIPEPATLATLVVATIAVVCRRGTTSRYFQESISK